MKIGKRVQTPDGPGIIIESIGPIPKSKPILVKLDKMIGAHRNFYYSATELK